MKATGAQASELVVILKDEDKTMREKFLLYNDYQVHSDDPVINSCIDKTKKNFIGEPESITIKITMSL